MAVRHVQMVKTTAVSWQPVLPFIRAAGTSVYRPTPKLARRLLDYLLILVLEGVAVVRVDGLDHRLGPGELGLVQPGRLVTLAGVAGTSSLFAHLDVFYNPFRDESYPTRPGQTDLSGLEHLLQPRLDDLLGVSVPVRLHRAGPDGWSLPVRTMVAAWQRHDFLGALEAQHLATGLVLQVMRGYAVAAASPLPAVPSPRSLDWVDAYLSLRLAAPISVADMAARARLSPSRFAAVFRRRFGQPPHRYLRSLRIQHAQLLLRSTDLTVREIAECCGFADPYHLSKAFKAATGSSPRTCRTAATRPGSTARNA